MRETPPIILNPAATLHHTHDTRFKTARISLFTVLPADERESPLTTLLFGVLRRGSERYPRLALLNRRLDELFGTTLTIRNYLHGDCHVVVYTAEMTEKAFLPPTAAHLSILDGVMELLADMILHPLTDSDGNLRADAVEKEKQALCDSLRSQRNDTRTWAGNRLREIMCDGEPYGLSIGGRAEEVGEYTAADVTSRYRSMLDMTRMEVFYTGRESAERVECAFRSAFGDWHPTRLTIPRTLPHLPPVMPRAESEDMEVSQSKLCMGWACGENFTTLCDDPDTLAAYAVCNEIFGVMQNSLLFRHVREERGLCYFCDSALDMTKGILWVSCGIRADKHAETEEAITAQLTALQRGDIDPADVELAKLSLQNGYRQLKDSQSSLSVFSFGRILNGTTDTPDRELERILAVTPADVARVAARFRPDTVFFLNGTAEGEEEEFYDD